MILYGIVDVSVNVHVQSNCKLPNNKCIFILSLSKTMSSLTLSFQGF